MRVLFFNPSGCLGGAERSLLALLDPLRSRPGLTAGLLLTADGPLADESRRLGLNPIVLPMPGGMASVGESGATPMALGTAAIACAPAAASYLRRLGHTISDWRPDVLHTTGVKAHLLGALGRPRGTRLIWHLHDYVSLRSVSSRLLGLAARRCSAAVAVSESVAGDARAVLGDCPVTVVENGVDLMQFRAGGAIADLDAMAGRAPCRPGTLRVGLVATYARWKGHDVFLRALARLPQLPVQGYVIGGPVYQTSHSQWSRRELERLSRELALGDRVRFVPFTPDVPPVLRALDVVVHASTRPEPFGLVIAEAMACGRPVVASRAGGAASLVQHGADGLLHEPGDAAGLAEAIGAYVSSAEARRSLADAACRTAMARFDRTRSARDIWGLYSRLTAGAPAASAECDPWP